MTSEDLTERLFQFDRDVVLINIEPYTRYLIALNSDAKREINFGSFGMHFFPRGSEFYYKKEYRNRARVPFVEVGASLSEELYAEADIASGALEARIELTAPNAQYFAELIRTQFEFQQKVGAIDDAFFCDALAVSTFGEVVSQIAPSQKLESFLSNCDRTQKVLRAVDFAHSALDQAITLGSLAEAASMSKFHFARSFRAHSGRSPMSFVIEMRIKRAKRLLATTDLSLVEVAFRCGFGSQAHFTTTFRRLAGKTPGQFRRRR